MDSKKAILSWLSDEFSLQESRRYLERALLADLSSEPDLEKQVRLANKVLNSDNRLTEATAQQLIDFGYTNTKMIQKFLGKETFKKQADQEKLDSAGVFREKQASQMLEEKIDNEPKEDHIRSISEKETEIGAEEAIRQEQEEVVPPKENMETEALPEQVQKAMDQELTKSTPENIIRQESHNSKESLPEQMVEESIEQKVIRPILDHFSIEQFTMEFYYELMTYKIPKSEVQPILEPTNIRMMTEAHVSDDEAILPQDLESDNEDVCGLDEHKDDEQIQEPVNYLHPIEPEAPQLDTSDQKTKADIKSKRKVKFKDAIKFFRAKEKPEGFSGEQDKFIPTMEYINFALNKFKQRTELSKFITVLGNLSRLSIQVPDLKEMQQTEEKAIKLRDSALSMSPNELVSKREELELEYKSVPAVEILELDMIFSEMGRDLQTLNAVNETIENWERYDHDHLANLKNRVNAAAYHISKAHKYKIYDLYIISLITAWRDHDHGAGKPRMDYITLKDVMMVLEDDVNNKPRLIKPSNADFCRLLFANVRAELKKVIESLVSVSDDVVQVEQSYKRFVDFTLKLMEHKNKKQKEERTKKEKTTKLAHVLKPSDKQHKINLKIDYDIAYSEPALVKPAFVNSITHQHRKYFLTMFTQQLESNNFLKLDHDKAYKRAAIIERDLYDKNLTKPFFYDNIGVQILSFIKAMRDYKYISYRVRDKKFVYGYLIKQMIAVANQMPRWEANYKKQFVQVWEKSKREDKVTPKSLPVAAKYVPEEAMNRMLQEPVEGQDYVAALQEPQVKPKYILERNNNITLKPATFMKQDYFSYRIFEDDFTIDKDPKKFSNVVLI